MQMQLQYGVLSIQKGIEIEIERLWERKRVTFCVQLSRSGSFVIVILPGKYIFQLMFRYKLT